MLNKIKIFIITFLLIIGVFAAFYVVFADENYLNLIYPLNNSKINADSTFFIGNTNVKSELTINGEPVKLHKQGAFVHVLELKEGKNNIVLTSKKDNFEENLYVTLYAVKNKSLTSEKLQSVKKNDKVLVIKDKEVPLRNYPSTNGKRLTPAKEGAVFKAEGIVGDYYKIKLDNGFGYILNKFTQEFDGDFIQTQTLKNISFSENSKNIEIKIPLIHPVLTDIFEKQNGLTVKLYGTKFEFDNYLIKSSYIRDFNFKDNSFSIDLASVQINGYDYEFKNNDFILTIRKPFDKSLKGKVVVIDPGHGGAETGAIGPTGVPEKDINLKISLYLKKYLKRHGAKVYLTRNEDEATGLYERVDFAKNKNADILISIHNNALPDGENPYFVHGTTTYYYHLQAKKLANDIQNELLKKTKFNNLGIKTGNYVLTRPSYPVSALVEVGFMIHPYEYEMLQKSSFQKKAAYGIYKGIKNYFEE